MFLLLVNMFYSILSVVTPEVVIFDPFVSNRLPHSEPVKMLRNQFLLDNTIEL